MFSAAMLFYLLATPPPVVPLYATIKYGMSCYFLGDVMFTIGDYVLWWLA